MEPVKRCVSSNEFPNWVDPDSKSIDELINETLYCFAVRIPFTVRFCSTSAEPDTTSPFLILNSFAIFD